MPGLFDTYEVRGVTLPNRVVLAPMAQWSAEADGRANRWHLVHYGTRAVGGPGLVMMEGATVDPTARGGLDNLGIWEDAQIAPLAEIVDFCHEQDVMMGIQLSHGGRKVGAPDNENPDARAVGPSAVAFTDGWATPHELSKSEIAGQIESFVAGAKRVVAAGFDVVEIHGAHGYLVSSFFSPLANHRTDEYGGDIKARSRFGCEMTEAIRAAIPNETALFIRINGSDLAAGGSDPEEMAVAAEMLHAAGADVIDVSAGGNSPEAPSIQSLYPGYQLEIAATIKRLAVVPTIAVGMIRSPAMAEEIVQNGRADLVAIGREMLGNPYWPRIAARKLGAAMEWPEQYETAW